MHKSKLLEIIQALDERDYKPLLKFVNSNNKSEGQTTLLLKHILKSGSDFKSKKLTKEKTFKVVFPDKEYNDVLMRRCMSRLFQMCEDYVVSSRVLENKQRRKLELLTFYGEKKLDRHFSNLLRNWKQGQLSDTIIDDLFFFREFLVEKEVSMHIFRQQDRTAEPNLQQISNNLDAFYLIHKLKVCCASISYQTLSKKKYDLPLLEELLVYLSKNESELHPLVQAYYYALMALKSQEGEVNFYKLKHILFAEDGRFNSNQMDLFSHAQNYCIRQIHTGQQKYRTELLDLYKMGLTQEIIIEEGIVSPLDFKNIVTLGISLKDFDWVENFIEDYTPKLEEQFRESFYHYNLAKLYFSKKEFKKVVLQLHQVEHQEIFVALDVKVILLKTYYELEEFDALHSLIDSFRMFLSRKKNLTYHKIKYQNFLKLLRHLIRLRFVKSEIEAFKEAVINEKEVIGKAWFLEKVGE